MIIHTNALEEEAQAGTSFFDCFKGVDLRRTEIACGVWSIQNLCGSCFMGYSTYFLESAGLPVVKAFDMSLAQCTFDSSIYAFFFPIPTNVLLL